MPRVRIHLDYRIGVERTIQPRARGVSRLFALGTGCRAFNASDRLPPNTMAAATMMMGCIPVTSYIYQLNLEDGKGTGRYCHARRKVLSDDPSRYHCQCFLLRNVPDPSGPQGHWVLHVQELFKAGQCSNNSRRDT